MFHADKTVTVYVKTWDADKAVDVYHGLVLKGVSFFARKVSIAGTDGLTDSNEAVCRIPVAMYKQELKPGDLICEGVHAVAPNSVDEIHSPFTIVSVTKNTGGKGPHIKVVAK